MRDISTSTLAITMVKPGVYTPGNRIKRRSIDTQGFSKRAVLLNFSHHHVQTTDVLLPDTEGPFQLRVCVGMADLPFYPTDIDDLDHLPGWGADEVLETLVTISPGNVDEPSQCIFDVPDTGGRYVWLKLWNNALDPRFEIGMSATLLLAGGGIYPLDPANYADRVTP